MKTFAASIELSEATAENMGCDTFAILQRDETGTAQSVVLSRGDLEAILAAWA